MTRAEIPYNNLKRIAASEEKWLLPLEEIKQLFMHDIKSNRRLENVQNISHLIDVLERRDLLSPDNIEPLRILADHCPSKVFQGAIATYERPKQTKPEFYNIYQEERLAENIQPLKLSESAKTSTTTPTSAPQACAPFVPLSDAKRLAIHKLLSRELGKFWRGFGRELEIGEGTMDELEIRFPRDLSSRIVSLLHLFEEDECHDPKHNVLLICRALDGCQRKDLRRKVENIMSH